MIRKNILVVPSFYCERHCKYCMYRQLTYDHTVFDMDAIANQVEQLITKWNIVDGSINIGNGGNLTALGYQYIDTLLTKIEQIQQRLNSCLPVIVLANLDNEQDVEMWNSIFEKHDIEKFCVSLNRERPFNHNTESLINKLSHDIRQNLVINIVCFDSVIKAGPKSLIEYLQQYQFDSVNLNEFVETTLTNWKSTSTSTGDKFYEFLYQFLIEANEVGIKVDVNDDYKYNTHIIDVIVTGQQMFVFNTRTKSLQQVTIDNIDDVIAGISRITYSVQCLSCDQFYRCPEKDFSRNKYSTMCDHIKNIIRLFE